jgi:NTE family protein
VRLRTQFNSFIIDAMGLVSELQAIPLFAELAEDALRELAVRVQRRTYSEGEVILRAGDAPREMHVVLHGAVRVELGEGAGRSATQAILAAGHSVGEMSVLSGNPVSATVVAHTDSTTLAISATDLAALLEREPALYRRISALLIERLRHRTQMLASRLKPTAAILAVDRAFPVDTPVVRAIFRGVSHYAPGSQLFDARQADASALRARVERWRDQGAAEQFLIVALDADRFAEVRPALLAGDAALRIAGAAGGQSVQPLYAGAADAKSILLDFPASAARAGAWSESLSSHELAECIHGATWNRAAHPCLDRIARFITRREVGVAMSVGAAAGFAHLGSLQVLEDCGVPIDFLCGSSMGGVVALGFAQLREAAKATDALCTLGAAFARSRGLQVMPRAALVSTQRMREIAKEMFGAIHFAELGLPAAVVAADLVAGERIILDRGPVAEAARATIAIPGIFPPVRVGNRILVDGGLVTRVPADLLARRRCGLRIASIVLPQRPLSQHLAEEAERLEQRLEQPFGLRAALGASWRMLGWWDSASQAGKADLFIRIPTPVGEGYDFTAGRRMAELGRRAALEQLDGIRDAARRLLAPGAP